MLSDSVLKFGKQKNMAYFATPHAVVESADEEQKVIIGFISN